MFGQIIETTTRTEKFQLDPLGFPNLKLKYIPATYSLILSKSLSYSSARRKKAQSKQTSSCFFIIIELKHLGPVVFHCKGIKKFVGSRYDIDN